MMAGSDVTRERLDHDDTDPRWDTRPRAPAMKWWGWGEEDVSFTHEGKPELAPFIERVLGLDVRRPGTSAIAFEDLEIPAAGAPRRAAGRARGRRRSRARLHR